MCDRLETLDPVNKYLREYEAATEEMVVLLADFSKVCLADGDVYFPYISFIAYIDNDSKEIVSEKGILNWVVPNFSGDYIYEFEDYEICRVLVRKRKPDVRNYRKNCYHIVQLLERDLKEPRLEAIREEYLRPVSIVDRTGTFCLDRKYNLFEGQIDWLGSVLKVCLEKDSDCDTAEKALQTLHLLVDDAEKWDRTLKSYAARQLTDLANDWRQEEDPEITAEEFAKRIGTSTFRIDKWGGFEAEYEDDNIFYGHWIIVYGNADGELEEATIED